MATEKHHRMCPLCEATCGLEITTNGREVTDVRGNTGDVLSEGYICPKGVAIKELDADPDRLRTPMIREGDTFRSATWDEAFSLIGEKLNAIIAEHGRNAVGAYLGNPTVHNTGLSFFAQAFLRTLSSENLYSATTVDQAPKQLASALMFGTGLSIPIVDIDHTDYLIIMGANPLVSNGSLMTAPNFGERMKRLRKRGGKILVIDPRTTKTAKAADEHLFIQPGTDAHFLFGIVHTLFEEELIRPGRLEEFTEGFDEVKGLAESFPPETVSKLCGIPAQDIRRIAREIAAADSAAVYARIGTCTQEFGTLSSWLPEVIHVLTGNLDRTGGAMFTLPAHGAGNCKGKPGVGRGLRMARRKSRVSGRPEIFGEFPVGVLAEEIETPGEGQIRAMVTIAGNPLLSNPNTTRITKAFESLEFMVSIDIYLNETTQYADVILPGTSPLERCQYNAAFTQLAVRNVARYSPAIFEVPENQLAEWEIILRLTAIVSGLGTDADLALMDDMVATQVIQRETQTEGSPVHGRDTDEIKEALKPLRGPERIVDFMIRTGPYGEGFGADPDGLTLAKLEANPDGIDLGALQPRVPDVLRTVTGKIELAPPLIVEDVARLKETLTRAKAGLLLVGRRHLRSNNSWMHNIPGLMTGKDRCTLQVNPADAGSLGLANGKPALVSSNVGSLTAPVEVTDEIMEGVVSLPHGWGHVGARAQMKVAAAHAGTNSNVLADEQQVDVPSGNAVLCGIPVTVEPAAVSETAGESTYAEVK